MEGFRDSVVAGEAPHGGDLVTPRVKGICELHQLGNAGLTQLVDGAGSGTPAMAEL